MKSEHNWLGSLRLKVFSLRHQDTKQVETGLQIELPIVKKENWRAANSWGLVWGVWSPVIASQPQMVEMEILDFTWLKKVEGIYI